MSSVRFDKIDIIKAIGIILMVCGHCNAPFTGWLYMFHMPIFFIASGYCWNSYNARNFSSTARYIWKKIKSLYIPYVVFNGTFAVLQDLFVKINVYTDNPLFLEKAGTGALYGLLFEESFSATLMSIKNCLLLNNSEQLGGATWFVGTLILISIFHCVYEYFINLTKLDRFRNILLILTTLAMLGLAEVIDSQLVSLPYLQVTHPFFAGYASFLMGIFIRQSEAHKKNVHKVVHIGIAVLFAVIIKKLMVFGGIGSGSGIIQNPVYYTVVSLLGWYMLESVSELIIGKLRIPLIYIGKNTLPIVFLHFLAFKIVSLAIVLATGMELFMIASFPVIFGLPQHMWIVYTVVGVGVPLLANHIYHITKTKLIKN